MFLEQTFKTVILNCNNILVFYSIFDPINAALVFIRDFFQKHSKSYQPVV